MKIEQLQYVLETAKHSSINKAAQNLYIAQSTLSSSIRSLEQELGSKIFNRTSKGVYLTDFGKEFYNHAKSVYSEIEFMQSLSLKISNSTVSLSVSNMFNPIANEAFIEIYNKYNDCDARLSIDEAFTMEIISNVEAGISDIGVIMILSNAHHTYMKLIESHGLEYHKFTDKDLYIVIGPKNPYYDSDKESITFKELSNFSYCTYFDAKSDSAWRNLSISNCKKRPDIRVGSSECLINFLAKTDAFTLEVFNSKDHSSDKFYNDLKFIKLDHDGLNCEIGWVAKSDKPLSPIAKEYLKILQDKIDENNR